MYRTTNGFLHNIRNRPRNIVMMHLPTVEVCLKFHNQLLPELIQIVRDKLRNCCADELLHRIEVIVDGFVRGDVFGCHRYGINKGS